MTLRSTEKEWPSKTCRFFRTKPVFSLTIYLYNGTHIFTRLKTSGRDKPPLRRLSHFQEGTKEHGEHAVTQMNGPSDSRRPAREPSCLKPPAPSLQLARRGGNSNRRTPKKLKFSLTYTKQAPNLIFNRHTYTFFVISNRYSFSCFQSSSSSASFPFAPAPIPPSGRIIRARFSGKDAQLLEIIVTIPKSAASLFLIDNFCALFKEVHPALVQCQTGWGASGAVWGGPSGRREIWRWLSRGHGRRRVRAESDCAASLPRHIRSRLLRSDCRGWT